MPVRVFLDWAELTAPAAARWLLDRRPGHLEEILVIVPTQQAGRRLRAALAGVPPPAILTPAQFLDPSGDELADPIEAALALAAELAGPRAGRFHALFPAGVPARNFSERLALARRLRALQAELAEHGLTLAEAAGRLAAGSADAARWRDLARLVAAADDSLGRMGLRERQAVRLAMAREPRLPAGIGEVAVVAVADLQPVIALALERLREPVTVLVPAPSEADAFDAWGRPLAQAWIERDPGWMNFDEQVRLVARPDHLALDLDAGACIEIGLLDRELLPGIAEALAAKGLAAHDPTGQPVTEHWLVRTLGALAGLVKEPTFDRAVDLLRNGAVRAWLAEQIADFDADAAVEAADKIRSRHFPASLRAARPWIGKDEPLRAALTSIEALLAGLRARPIETARRLVADLTTAFSGSLDADERDLAASAREAMEDTLDRLGRATRNHPELSPIDWLHSLRESLAFARHYPARPARAVEASGWVELPWSDAPHLLLAGMNLGKVPAPLGAELFLNEAVRAALGLPGATERRARDAYFLARLLAMRPPGKGRLDALVVQMDAEGSPLAPSPLVFAGAGTALPARVERLFADARPPQPDPAWTAGWRLDPPAKEMKRAISVTDFERYLDCPFTFYLGRVLKMESFAPAADELDAAQFGDLAHAALEGWALDEAAGRSTDPAVIARALDAQVTAWVERNLGRRLALPLRVQVDSARSRLGAFAAWQAEDRRAGWRIRAVEKPFHEILGRPWELDGWTIAGRVDRLDENERTGQWRVVDYKTFDAADSPAKKHLRAFRPAGLTWPPDYARVPGSADWWINLQLPLYRQLLIESGRDPAMVACGYFNLPKTISETGLQTWDALDESLQASALACARSVLADLARRRFWPPNPRAAHAEFADFFAPDPLRIVAPDGAFVRSCVQ
ncbi:MAG: PD-(D/E)XK nuclease family protein [Terrimicrobiaceae bacterium]|nr:PD-(D/E)XK nuclease family protein [Terrimicrobiaceae bacterium]